MPMRGTPVVLLVFNEKVNVMEECEHSQKLQIPLKDSFLAQLSPHPDIQQENPPSIWLFSIRLPAE